MLNVMTADEAVKLIKDGDCIAVNSFVGIENPVELHEAIYRRYKQEGHPAHLTLVSAAGFGIWTRDGNAESYIREGAMDKLICGHFGAMMSTKELVLQDKFEAYNVPLGGIIHGLRAQAAGLPGALSKVGLGLFIDPRIEGPAINNMSRGTELAKYLASVVELDGEEFMYYKMPAVNVALIKASACDRQGNVTLRDEYLKGDALTLAQAAKAHKGKVLVQVDRITDEHIHPQLVDIPACLVDAVCVVKEPARDAAFESITGNKEVPYEELQDHLDRLNEFTSTGKKTGAIGDIIGRRGAKELKPGNIVNIGIGFPENVPRFARKAGILDKITLTVESGPVGGLPASGTVFGSMIGAGSVYTMAQQFDFYDGGGLDICYMGGLEVDKHGNVNCHRGPGAYSGVGGFSDITSNTKTVVFCVTFNTKGLNVTEEDGKVIINQDGSIPKFVDEVRSISFSGKKAQEKGQRVLYITERCVFTLTDKGMEILEVYPGIDRQRDIIDKLPEGFLAE